MCYSPMSASRPILPTKGRTNSTAAGKRFREVRRLNARVPSGSIRSPKRTTRFRGGHPDRAILAAPPLRARCWSRSSAFAVHLGSCSRNFFNPAAASTPEKGRTAYPLVTSHSLHRGRTNAKIASGRPARLPAPADPKHSLSTFSHWGSGHGRFSYLLLKNRLSAITQAFRYAQGQYATCDDIAESKSSSGRTCQLEALSRRDPSISHGSTSSTTRARGEGFRRSAGPGRRADTPWVVIANYIFGTAIPQDAFASRADAGERWSPSRRGRRRASNWRTRSSFFPKSIRVGIPQRGRVDTTRTRVEGPAKTTETA